MGIGKSSHKEQAVVKLVDTDNGSGDDSDGIDLDLDDEGGIYDEGESSDGLGMGFEYDNEYVC